MPSHSRSRAAPRRLATVLSGLVLGLAVAGTLGAQTWPERTITAIVPYAAGGGSDVVTRIVVEQVSKDLGQSVIVENVTGAGGATGTLRGRNARPDGYTIGFAHMGTHASAVGTNPKLPYDPRTDFDYIGIAAISHSMIIVRKDFVADTLSEFIAYAREKGKGLKMAHNGVGSLSHLNCLYFFQLIGVDPTFVVYRGYAQTVNDILSGAVDGTCDFVISARNHIQAGALKAYGLANPERSPLLPEVATSKEGGLPEFLCEGWFGFYTPKGLPPSVLARLREAFAKALDDPGVVKRINDIGGELPKTADRGGDRMLEIVKRDIERWVAVVRKGGATATESDKN